MAKNRDLRHLALLEELRALEPETEEAACARAAMTQAEREDAAALSALAAAQFDDPEVLYDYWRGLARDEAAREYVEDLIGRVRRRPRSA